MMMLESAERTAKAIFLFGGDSLSIAEINLLEHDEDFRNLVVACISKLKRTTMLTHQYEISEPKSLTEKIVNKMLETKTPAEVLNILTGAAMHSPEIDKIKNQFESNLDRPLDMFNKEIKSKFCINWQLGYSVREAILYKKERGEALLEIKEWSKNDFQEAQLAGAHNTFFQEIIKYDNEDMLIESCKKILYRFECPKEKIDEMVQEIQTY